MRIDLWDYPSYREIPDELRDHAVTYIGDGPGGCLVECGWCSKEFDTGPLDDQTQSCPHCNCDVIYPRADW